MRRNAAHYYERSPVSPPRQRTWQTTLRGREITIATDSGVFSGGRVDPGTRLLIEHVTVPPEATVCDLGCGYGAIGLSLAPEVRRVILVDINARALRLAKRNFELNSPPRHAWFMHGDGLAALRSNTLDGVITNPPIRAGHDVVYRFMRDAHRALRPGGSFWMVARTKQGAKTFRRTLGELFGTVDEPARGGGYRVLRATKGLLVG